MRSQIDIYDIWYDIYKFIYLTLLLLISKNNSKIAYFYAK